MVELGRAHGVRTVALLTDMDSPLGRAAGNGLEVAEAVAVLRGGGPDDLVAVTLALAQEMVALAGVGGGPSAGAAPADPAAALADGRALAVWEAMVRAQGGDGGPRSRGSGPAQVAAPASGYLRRLDARAVGVAVWRLGAGRSARTRCRRAPGPCACASRATRWRPASRCWSCTWTTSPASRAPWPPWRGPSWSGRSPRSTARSSSSGSRAPRDVAPR